MWTLLATSLLSKPSRALGIKSTILCIRSNPCFSDLPADTTSVFSSFLQFSRRRKWWMYCRGAEPHFLLQPAPSRVLRSCNAWKGCSKFRFMLDIFSRMWPSVKPWSGEKVGKVWGDVSILSLICLVALQILLLCCLAHRYCLEQNGNSVPQNVQSEAQCT